MWVCGESWNLRGQHNQERGKKKKPTEYAAASGEVAQSIASATSKRGLGREAGAALLRVRTGPECPEGNPRELTWASEPDCGIATTQKAQT